MAIGRLGRWGLAAALLTGCGDGGDGGAGGGGGAGGEPLFEGELPALETLSESDCASHFPLATEGRWRYRAKGEDDPGIGAEVRLERVDGEEDRYVRETVAVFDITLGEETRRVRQVLRETYVVEAGQGGVGPRVEYLEQHIEEHEVGTGALVRRTTREFLPAYLLISDAWNTGKFDNLFTSQDTRLTQVNQVAGEAEPDEESYILPELRIQTSFDEKILFVEGRYREHVRQIDVYDDAAGRRTRAYWVQPGVGVVQWQFADTANLQFVLTESNLEPEGKLHPSCAPPAGE